MTDATFLTADEVARTLRCTRKTVQRMIRRGDLKAVMVAGRWLVAPADLPTAGARATAPRRTRQAPPSGSLRAIAERMDAA